MIISGGVNIYPQEAENVLINHDKVLDVVVFGVPNPDFGEEVKGVVQLRNPQDASPLVEVELIDYCRSICRRLSVRAVLIFVMSYRDIRPVSSTSDC